MWAALKQIMLQARHSWVTWHGHPLKALQALHGQAPPEMCPPESLQECSTALWYDNPKRVYTGRPARGVATAGGPGGATSGSRPSANRRMTIARPSASPFSSRPTSVQTGLMNDAAAPGKAGYTCVPAKYGRTYDSGFSASICAPAHHSQVVSTGEQDAAS